MRYLTLFVDKTTRIEIENSVFTGYETIKYNGELVSKRWSLFGSVHQFNVVENGDQVNYEIRIAIKLPLRIGFDIYRDNKPILFM